MPARRALRSLAVLLGGLSLAGGGTLAAAGAAWSDGGRHHGHGSTTGAQTTTTVTTTTTSSATTTGTHSASNSGSSKSKSSSKGSSKPAKKAKPKPKPKVYLSAALLSAFEFPERALDVWTSPAKPLTAGQLQISENGQPVSGLKLTPFSQAPTSDFGVIVVLDESPTIDATSRSLEMSMAMTIAAQRKGSEQFGLVAFGASPTMVLPPSSDPQLINDALSSPALVAPGSSLLPALSMAYAQLQRARVPVGAVVVLTTGRQLASPATEAAASRAGLKLGYQTFVTDVAAPSGHSSGQSSAAKQQDKALGTQLPDGAGLWSRLAAGYEVSYRSSARPKQAVTVTVRANGFTGTPTMQYTAEPSAPTGPAAPSLQALSQYPQLASSPSFARVFPTVSPVSPARPAHSFWSSPLSLILVAVGCALLLALALILLVSGVRQSEVETRVSRFIPQEEAVAGQDPLVLAAPGVPAILARRRWWPKFVVEVDVARFRHSPVALVRRAIAGSLVAAVIFTLLLGSAAAGLLGLPVGPLVLYVAVRRAARKSRVRFAEQLPSHLQDMAGAMRGGRSMAGAIQAAADGAEDPSLGEFERVVADEQLGRPLETSLSSVARRMQSEDMQQVVLVAALHRRSGSSVAEALDHVAEGARERLELMRELRSLTGQARLSSRILSALPVAVVIVLWLIAPSYIRPLLHTVGGIVVLIMGIGMVGLGSLIMSRIVKVEA